MTLADWKRQFHVGQRLVCTYRWYWGKSADRPAPPDGREAVTVTQIRTIGILYKTVDKERVYLDFPKAHELKADEKGFELYFPKDSKFGDRAGILMSRYEWVNECSCGDAEDQRILGGPSPSCRVHGVRK